MKILTKRNGIALVAVLAVLLVLTLLIPVMFTMSENATKSAMQGTDAQRASYLARTMIEMSVAAFEDFYDMAEENQADYATKMKNFLTVHKSMTAQSVYMYRNDSVPYPEKPQRIDFGNEDAYNEAYEAYKAALEVYEATGVIYSTSADTPAGCSFVGKADCSIEYIDEPSYYKIDKDGNTTAINVNEYTGGKNALEALISNGVDVTNQDQYVKIDNKNVVFRSSATVNGKKGIRRCVLVLPTKPSEENWIAPASMGSNQIFPNTKLATGRTNINYDSGTFLDGRALKQPLYIFSCIGNMIINDKKMMIDKNAGIEGATPDWYDYRTYLRENNKTYIDANMSFGLHPETGTREPDNDPTFSCLRTYNMESWKDDAQLDNFVAYTATNAIQVDLPVNLIVNPSRTNRIGDGFDKNYSLYKVLVFQAPTIVFNRSVNSFISLNIEDNAYRMTTIMFAAPKSTPYSYVNGSRNKKTVKAGKVFFAEDAYVWVIPYDDNGSGYKTQTVYYKNKDIILYKIANAGDIYYFNAEVETDVNGKKTTAGFSLTGYFMDVIYNTEGDNFNNNKWWQVWSNAKLKLFNNLLENFGDRTYLEDDFKWIGNVYSGTGDKIPVVDDFYVIWDS